MTLTKNIRIIWWRGTKRQLRKKLYVTYIVHTEIETNWELLQIKPIIRVTINHANKLYQVKVDLFWFSSDRVNVGSSQCLFNRPCLIWRLWRRQGEWAGKGEESTHSPPPFLSSFLTISHPLGTSFFFSSASAATKYVRLLCNSYDYRKHGQKKKDK